MEFGAWCFDMCPTVPGTGEAQLPKQRELCTLKVLKGPMRNAEPDFATCVPLSYVIVGRVTSLLHSLSPVRWKLCPRLAPPARYWAATAAVANMTSFWRAPELSRSFSNTPERHIGVLKATGALNPKARNSGSPRVWECLGRAVSRQEV